MLEPVTNSIIKENDKTLIRRVISEESSKEVRRALESVVANGTGRNAYIEGYSVGGKTGTAQQVETRPNHGLFIGYAPSDDPEISIAARISFGYSSHNAASAARNIISYYYKEQTLDEILAAKAEGVNTSESSSVGDWLEEVWLYRLY